MATEKQPVAVLVGVQLTDVSAEDFASSLEELRRLAQTLGFRVLGQVTQARPSLAPAAVLGEGKLRELARLTGGTGVVPSGVPERPGRRAAPDEDPEDVRDPGDAEDAEGAEDAEDAKDAKGAEGAPEASVVVVDHELSPTQARNLERATGAEVLDRTAVILEIFHRHARSREAKLQVELARLAYVAPRLRAGRSKGDRQQGGIGGKGAGESSAELERRHVRDRMAELRRELQALSTEQSQRRARRQESLRVALVGYTNAGKSSLMRALTGSEVLVADKLFATLDTTVRPLAPESHPRVLVSDTVGFIKRLPHDLVASFRSTLDEAREASLLLHVVDASDPAFRAQRAVTLDVLAELGAAELPTRLVLNKCDRLSPEELSALGLEVSDAWQVSARDPARVASLREAILAHFEARMSGGSLRLSHAQLGLLGTVHERCRVLSEAWDEAGVTFQVRALPADLARLRAQLDRD
ncbi:MAG: GTPase HflX [Deltaproteobacteria bacterium]|nr:GTPase HflX [Deltaproteobacteria bacterium]